MEGARMPNQTWSIVSVADDGGRIRAFIQRWLGHPKPKPYCAFVGGRSLFQHTLDRAAGLCQPERIVTVIAREHCREAWSQLDGRTGGTVLVEPRHCETAASIFLPLTYIRARDPRATVVLYPSDHFVYPEYRFLGSVRRAVWTAEWLPERLVLLGVPPDRLELDYGWILPGDQLDGSTQYQIKAVEAILEKPTAVQADAALAGGALWNTGVLAAKAELVWQLGWQCFPDLMARFEAFSAVIGTPREAGVLDEMYQEMPAHHFFSELVQCVPERTAVIEMSDVLWSDWGKPEWITNSLRRIGRQPAFPLECLNRPFAPISQPGSEGAVAANM
ncbi:MAG TPA: sugar phosphate nucleotidyltransferase [Nitrospira sp.]|nr:sugar phosphate nucleotidyltransferase [Nitrospira sp.]